jgi:nitrate reductase alpha subunit
MSHFLDRLNFFKKVTDTFSGDHGIVTNEDRGWEDASPAGSTTRSCARPTG